MNMKKWLHILFSLGLLLGVNVPAQRLASAAQAEQIFRMGVDELPVSLNPAVADRSSTTVIKGLFEGLVRLNKAGQVLPGMAEKWSISNDGRTYTFTLRNGLKWSNQQPVKASDFEYAWKQALEPSGNHVYAFNLFVIAGAKEYNSGKLKDPAKIGVKAIDNTTLQVTLTEKTSYFLQLLAESIYLPVNAKAAKGNKKWADDVNTIVTNGPFKLSQWNQKEITLVKNPDYYAAQEIHFTKVQVLAIQGAAAMTEAYLQGNVDWFAGDHNIDFKTVRSTVPGEYTEMPFGSTYYYQFNLHKAPFHNLKIRKALAMALDRESVIYGTPAFGIIPNNIRGAQLNFRSEFPDTKYFKENPALAKKLLMEGLKEEGWSGLPSFSILTNGYPHSLIAERVIASWKKNLGIEVSIEVQEWSALLKNRQKQNFTMARAGWGADFNDPASFMEYFSSWSADNDSGWKNPQYDSYIKQARQTMDAQSRMQLYAKAEKLLIDQMVILPVYYYVESVLQKPNVKGVYVDYNNTVAFTRGYK